MSPKTLIGVDLDAVPLPGSLAAQFGREKPNHSKQRQLIWCGIELWIPKDWALTRAGGNFVSGVLRFAQIETPKDLKDEKIEMVVAGADLTWGPIPEESTLRSLTKMSRLHKKKLKREYKRSLKTFEDYYVEINEHPAQFLNLEYTDKTKIGKIRKLLIDYESIDLLFPCQKTKRGFILAYFARADIFANMEKNFLQNMKTFQCHTRGRDYWYGFGWSAKIPEPFFIESGKCTDESGVITFRAGQRKEQRRMVITWMSRPKAESTLNYTGDITILLKNQLNQIDENLDDESSLTIHSEDSYQIGGHQGRVLDYQLVRKETFAIIRLRTKMISWHCKSQDRIYFVSIGAPLAHYEKLVMSMVEKLPKYLKCHKKNVVNQNGKTSKKNSKTER